MPIKHKYSFPLDKLMTESLVDLSAFSLSPSLSIMPVQSAWKALEKAATVIASNNEGAFHLSENEYPLLDSKPEVGRPSKAIGKKRRARLLSENLKDMKLMNRKRWELKSSADCLKDRRSDENVQLSVLCQHFTAKGLNPSKDVLAFHQVDNKGVMNSRKSQSQRGFTLSELDVESGEKPLNIKAQSLDKAKPLPRSTKRAQLYVSIYSTDNEELNDDEIGLLSPGSAAQSEEIAKMYQAPRQQTYNLSDFVTERQEPVIVRTQRTSRHVPLDSFVQVEIPNVEDIDRSTQISPMSKLGQTNSLFKTIYMPCKSLTQDVWLEQCAMLMDQPDLHFRWLNSAKCSFQLDLTSLLMTSKSPHLVLTAAYETIEERVRLLLNGSQECQVNMAAIEAALATKFNGLNAMIQVLIKNAKINATERKEVSIAHNIEFNSTNMSVSVSPLDDNSLLYATKTENLVVQQSEEEDEDDFDFEHIDMSDFIDSDQALDSKWKDSALDEQVAQMKTLCDECGENDTTKIILFDDCAHSFCTRCLKASLYQQVCENTSTLCCSFKNCASKVPLPTLLSIFELPVLKSILHSCAEAKAKQTNQQLFSCQTGCGLGFVEMASKKINQVQCNSCKNHFCLDCYSTPHWPMTCEQNAVWSRKRDLQIQKQGNDDGKNEISQQFWQICSEARTRRYDVQSTRKVAKDVLKHVGYKLERQFLEIRKACLQLVENGFGFLYITRNTNRPQNWQSVKANLTALYKELNKFESSLLNNTHSAENIAENIQKLRVTLKKVVTEINNN